VTDDLEVWCPRPSMCVDDHVGTPREVVQL